MGQKLTEEFGKKIKQLQNLLIRMFTYCAVAKQNVRNNNWFNIAL